MNRPLKILSIVGKRLWYRLGQNVRSFIFRMPRRIVLIRHAESLRNQIKGGRTYFNEADWERRQAILNLSDRQIPLSEKGYVQAKALGLYLLKEFGVPAAAFHSGYLRASETLQTALSTWREKDRQRIRIIANNRLRELEPGYTWNMTEGEVVRYFPWLAEHQKNFGAYDSRPPGGESKADHGERVLRCIREDLKLYAGRTIFIFCHGGTIEEFCAIFERWKPGDWPNRPGATDCSVTVYEYDILRDRMRLRDYNVSPPGVARIDEPTLNA